MVPCMVLDDKGVSLVLDCLCDHYYSDDETLEARWHPNANASSCHLRDELVSNIRTSRADGVACSRVERVSRPSPRTSLVVLSTFLASALLLAAHDREYE